jgi:hypothetical protein
MQTIVTATLDSLTTFEWSKLVYSVAGAALTACVAVLLWWLNRKRPALIECRELAASSLVRVYGDRDQIAVSYKGQSVARLSQLELRLVNSGSEPITSATVNLSFAADTRVLQFTTSDTACAGEITAPNEVKFEIPLLNPFRPHKHKIDVAVVCDGSVLDVKAHGQGQGWSVRYRRGTDIPRIVYFAMGAATSIFAFLASLLADRFGDRLEGELVFVLAVGMTATIAIFAYRMFKRAERSSWV